MPLSMKKTQQPQQVPLSPRLRLPFLRILVSLFKTAVNGVACLSLLGERGLKGFCRMCESLGRGLRARATICFPLSAKWDAYLDPAFLLGLLWNSPRIVDFD